MSQDKTAEITVTQALNRALDDAMAADSTVLVLGEDVADAQGGGVVKITKGLSTKYGTDRVKSTPISEQAIIGAAVGAAMAGMRPVAEIMLMNFTAVCADQIFNHAAKTRFMTGGQTQVPIVIRTLGGAGRGTGGQHGDLLEAWYAHAAGLKVVAPANPADAYGLMTSCIFENDPCIFIEHIGVLGAKGPAPQAGHRVPLGRGAVSQEGRDVTVISYARQANEALIAARKLAEEGVSVEVIDLRSIAPLDWDTVLSSVAKTRRAVIVHEAVKPHGVGAEISARINEELFGQLKAPVQRLGAPYSPIPFSKPLETAFIPAAPQIEAAIRKVLG